MLTAMRSYWWELGTRWRPKVGELSVKKWLSQPELLLLHGTPYTPEVINRKLATHISQEGLQAFLEHSHSIPKDKIISLLQLALNNCVFSFQHKFYKQLQGAAIGSPISPAIANIYMEYFEELALGPQWTIPTPWWKRYVDDVICIIKKDQVDILFSHINQLDYHIKFTIESPDNEGIIPFLDTKSTPNSNHTIHTIVYRKPTHTDRYLDWNSNHPISAKRSVIQTLTHRAKVVCFTPELLPWEMHYLDKVLHRNSTLAGLWKKTPITGLREIKLPPRKPPRKPLSQFHISKDQVKSLEGYLRTLKS